MQPEFFMGLINKIFFFAFWVLKFKTEVKSKKIKIKAYFTLQNPSRVKKPI